MHGINDSYNLEHVAIARGMCHFGHSIPLTSGPDQQSKQHPESC